MTPNVSASTRSEQLQEVYVITEYTGESFANRGKASTLIGIYGSEESAREALEHQIDKTIYTAADLSELVTWTSNDEDHIKSCEFRDVTWVIRREPVQ